MSTSTAVQLQKFAQQALPPVPAQPTSVAIPAAPSAPDKSRSRWRYIGYRGASQWMTSEDDFFVIRRFATLHTRVLLAKQAEISELEQRLDEMDKPSHKDFDNSTVLLDPNPNRVEVLNELWKALKEYDDFIISYSELKARPSASEQQLRNVEVWMKDNKGAVCEEEASFIAPENQHDLMPVTPRVKTLLRRFMDRWRKFSELWPFRQPASPYLKDIPSDGSNYFSDASLDRLAYILTVLLALAMLITPLWWLNYVSRAAPRLGIITGFVVVFAGIIGGITPAKPFETMAATAGYAAVLMVFMQVNGNSNSPALSATDLAKTIVAALAESKLNLTDQGSKVVSNRSSIPIALTALRFSR